MDRSAGPIRTSVRGPLPNQPRVRSPPPSRKTRLDSPRLAPRTHVFPPACASPVLFRSLGISFLSRILGRSTAQSSEPRVFVGAFGKHPAWDDHLDDLGLDTERLVSIKRVLYAEGISANVDSGAWENLDPSQRLDAFDHDFLWWVPLNNAPDVTIGRLAASTDGKGRSKYPMVLIAQCSGCSLPWAAHQVPAMFAQTRERRRQAQTQDQVRAEVDLLRAELNAQIASAPRLNASTPGDGRSIVLDAASASALVEALAQEQPEALARSLYAIRTQCAGFLPDTDVHTPATPTNIRLPLPASLASGSSEAASFVPASPAAASVALSGWLTILLLTLDPATPVLLVKPAAGSWVDALVGEPGPQQVFALRAGEARVSKVSDVPFTLDAEAQRRADALRERLRMAAAATGSSGLAAAAQSNSGLTIPLDRSRKLVAAVSSSRLRLLAPIGVSLCAWAAASALPPRDVHAAQPGSAAQPSATQPASNPPARLDSRARYNLLLEALARSLRPGADGAPPSDAAARAATTSFIAEAMQLPGGVAYLREVSQTLDALQQALDAVPPTPDQPAPNQPAPTPSALPAQPPRVGPGSIPGVVATLLPDGRARFVLPASGKDAGGDGPTLEFVRVLVADGGKNANAAASPPMHAVWVSTTEVSAQVFNDLVDSLGSWRELAKVMPPFGIDQDERLGPRVWRWSFGKRAGSSEVVTLGLIPATGWLVRSEGPGSSDVYAKGLNPGAPNLDMPMQHLPPEAAMYAAGLLHCRLPTSLEWRAAWSTHPPGPDQSALNLRDQTWGRQQRHNEDRAAQGRRTWSADAGAFSPADTPDSKEPRSALIVQADDGVLWFAPVGVGGTGSLATSVAPPRSNSTSASSPSPAPPVTPLKHLVGNVAEWIWDFPCTSVAASTDQGHAANTRADSQDYLDQIDAARSLLDAHAASLGIVGGSALSDPRVPGDRVHRPILSEAREGYADVGFRLAFTDDHFASELGGADGLAPGGTAGGLSLADRLRAVLTPLPTLKNSP